MMLDVPRALDYLQGDEALLQEFLALFSNTVAELQPLLAVALQTSPAATSKPPWNAFYRSLHGAKPAIQVVGAEPLRQLVESLCLALASTQPEEAGDLAASLAPQLEALDAELARLNKPDG